jgi:hypothetical protein
MIANDQNQAFIQLSALQQGRSQVPHRSIDAGQGPVHHSRFGPGLVRVSIHCRELGEHETRIAVDRSKQMA